MQTYTDEKKLPISRKDAEMFSITSLRHIEPCSLLRKIINGYCRTPCSTSELSRMEFIKVVIGNALSDNRYAAWLKSTAPTPDVVSYFSQIFNELIKEYQLGIIKIETADMEKALEVAKALSWRPEEIKRKSFDVLLLAQAARRGLKLFTRDRGVYDIHLRVFGEAKPTGKRIKIYEGRHVLYAAIP